MYTSFMMGGAGGGDGGMGFFEKNKYFMQKKHMKKEWETMSGWCPNHPQIMSRSWWIVASRRVGLKVMKHPELGTSYPQGNLSRSSAPSHSTFSTPLRPSIFNLHPIHEFSLKDSRMWALSGGNLRAYANAPTPKEIKKHEIEQLMFLMLLP